MIHSAGSGRTSARIWGGTTAVLGAAFVLRPKPVAGLVSSGSSTPNPVIVQVLGGRQLLQGAAVLIRPHRLLLRAGSVADLLHAASMVAASRWWPRYRRPALVSAAIAGTSAVAGGLISRRTRR